MRRQKMIFEYILSFVASVAVATAAMVFNQPAAVAAAVTEPELDETTSLNLSPVELRVGTPEIAISHTKFVAPRTRDDMPPKAYRDAQGRIHLFGSSSHGYHFVGTTFENLTQTTQIGMSSPYDPDPSKFRHKVWVTQPYALGGNEVYAAMHNEFIGRDLSQYDAECDDNPIQGRQTCWYVTGTLAKSSDGGYNFASPAAPNNFLFGIPYKFSTDMVRAGIASYAFIKNPNDGYHYVLLGIFPYGAQQDGVCIARSTDNMKTWRFWNGTEFRGTFANPYVMTDAPENHVCTPIITEGIGSVRSLVYDEKNKIFVAVSTLPTVDEEKTADFVYATSKDLFHWSEPVVFYTNANPLKPDYYPSLIDTESTALNFDVTDGSLYLYWVQLPFGPSDNLHRDVMRARVSIVVPDVLKPEVRIVTPTVGQVVSNIASLRADITDDQSLASVRFKIDGVFVAEATSSTSRFATRWNSTSVPNGRHTLQVTAIDSSGNVRAAAAVFYVQNNPALSITAREGAISKGGGTRIYWSARNVKPGSCSVTYGSAGVVFGTGEQSSKPTGSLEGNRRYNLSCTDLSNEPAVASVVVRVTP